MIIAPSILSTNLNKLKETINLINNSPASWIHLDVMDGKFVPNTTFSYELVSEIEKMTSKIIDVHLMVENPEEKIVPYLTLNVDYITYHFEATTNHFDIINLIHHNNKKVGISIKPNTCVSDIIELLPYIDLVLVMSVEPGFGGQTFILSTIEKVNELILLRQNQNLQYIIEVDGGINNNTIKYVKDADCVVSGSYLFKQSNFDDAVKGLLELCEQ